MTSRVVILVVAMAVGWPDQQQTFRTITDAVLVDVHVRRGDRNVTGLTAADFVLTDNGVRQRIESVEPSTVPLDVTLVVDLSGNPRRPRAAHPDPARVAAALESEVRDVTKILRPTDRVRLLAIDRYVRQVWPFLPAAELPPIRGLEIDGLGSIYEGLAAALLHPVELARRHVVVVRTKGVDTISALRASALSAIAARSDALLHVVIMESALLQDQAGSAFQCVQMGFCWPVSRPWVPIERRLVGQSLWPDGIALKAGVDATGGGWHQTMMIAEPTLTSTFRDVFDGFRTGYVLRYTPQGVSRAGWHAIDVTVPAEKGATVRARKGYGIDDTPPPAAAPSPVTAVPRTIQEFAAAYERGAFQTVADGLRRSANPERLIRDFSAAGNPWPAAPRREAVFAIELADAVLFHEDADVRKSGEALLTKFSRLGRHPLGPDAFERQWYVAVLALLQGTIRPTAAQQFVDYALARFPGDPQFLLARAIVADQALLAAGGARSAATGGARGAPPYEEAYGEAMKHPSVAVEARIRLAMRLHLSGRNDDALGQLEAAGTPAVADPTLGYLRLLFLGRVHAALGRRDDAVAALRAALEIVPPGQAARVALMNQLLLGGLRSDAVLMADIVEAERSPVYDPWWLYWQGQYRSYEAAVARLREMAQPPK